MNAASHKYKDKKVKMSNQKYVDQMCEKKAIIRKKIVSYNNEKHQIPPGIFAGEDS